MLDTVVISGEDVCYIMVFGTLVGVFVFSVMWYELLMTSAISCPLWSLVYKCQRVECLFISLVMTDCGRFVMCCKQYCTSVSADLQYVVVLSRGGIYMFTIVMGLVLLMCTLVPTTPTCMWWNWPEEDVSSGKLEETHPSRTIVKSIKFFYGIESVVRGNPDSLLN